MALELDNIQIPALFVFLQMTFEMSHETLYLAVKLVDHYLMKVICKKDKLQLLGSTAFMIAAKFEVSPNPWDLEKINFCPSHVCMYVHVCVHVCIYIIYIHTTCMHVYTFAYMCICVCIQLHSWTQLSFPIKFLSVFHGREAGIGCKWWCICFLVSTKFSCFLFENVCMWTYS